jgi:hypothetical protein
MTSAPIPGPAGSYSGIPIRTVGLKSWWVSLSVPVSESSIQGSKVRQRQRRGTPRKQVSAQRTVEVGGAEARRLGAELAASGMSGSGCGVQCQALRIIRSSNKSCRGRIEHEYGATIEVYGVNT